MPSAQLQSVFDAIDAANADDPSCLAYGRNMTAVLAELESEPSDALAIAVRAQHIRRFEIPRTRFPDGLVGYKKWRAELGRYHAELASKLALEAGFHQAVADRVGQIVRKLRLGQDPEVQVLEDAACLVFVRHGLDDFATKHEPDKVVRILAKTLLKMSEKAKKLALESELSKQARELLQKAISESR